MHVTVLHDVPVSPNLAACDSGTTCAYAQSTVLADGRVVCTCRRGTTKHSSDGILVLQESADNGNSWSESRPVFDGTTSDPRETVVSGGVCAIAPETLLVTFGSVLGLETATYVFSDAGRRCPRRLRSVTSTDAGRTWQVTNDFTSQYFVRAGIAGSPFVFSNGSVGVPVEVTILSGVQGTALAVVPTPADLNGNIELPVIAGDSCGRLNLCDAHFACLPNGDVLMLLWTFEQDGERTVNVRRSISVDNGVCWSIPEPTAIEGQVTVPLSLPSGQVIAATNYRKPPEGIYLWTSTDNGRTWDSVAPIRMWDEREKRIVAHQEPWQCTVSVSEDGVWAELAAFTFGTPDLALLNDGSVLLTYYATLNDVTHIRACRFRVN